MTVVGKRFGDVESLPEEIRAQIEEKQKSIALDEVVFRAIVDLNGTATIGELLVHAFRATGNKELRKQTISRSVYRLKQAGVIEPVAPGVYKLLDGGNTESE